MGKKSKTLLTLFLFIICSTTGYFLLNRLGYVMPLSQINAVFCLSSCPPEKPVHPKLKNEQSFLNNKGLKELLGNKFEKEKISLLVEKSKYQLTVFYNLKPVKSYPVVFGSSPNGDKFHEGDNKTPEGIYYIRDLYPHSAWSKFIWLDYPTPQSWREHYRAKLAGEIDFLLPIGSEIGIHGVPKGKDSLIEKRSNWTWGCVSLKNQDVDEIYEFVSQGTLVEILP